MRYFWALVPYASYIVVVVMALLVGIVLDRANVNQHLVEQRFSMLEDVYEVHASLEHEIEEALWLTQGLVAVITARPGLSQEDFDRAVSRLTRNTHNIINVAAAPDLVIEYVYPLVGNEAALGIDLTQRSNLMGAVQEAIDTGVTIFAGPVELVQGGRGFITRSAVNLHIPETTSTQLWGVVSLVIDADGMFALAGLGADTMTTRFLLRNAEGQVLAGDPDVTALDPVSRTVTAPGVDWTIEAVPSNGWSLDPPNREQTWLVVLMITLVVLAIFKAIQWAFTQKDVAETQLEEAIESLSEGFALYDASGRLTMCNQNYRDLYPTSADIMKPGTSFEDILRRGVETGQYPEAEGRGEEWIAERVEAQRNPSETMELQLPDGRWLRLQERKTPSGSVAGMRLDITELKRAIEESEAANAAKTDFLNTMSHELRTPLSVILGYNTFMTSLSALPSYRKLHDAVTELKSTDITARLAAFRHDINKFSNQIDASGKHLMALIASVLDIAAIEEGTLELKPESLNLEEALNDVVGQLQIVAQKGGIDLQFENQAGDVWADPVRFRQILINIIGNAVKFTDEGSVTVRSSVVGEMTCIEVIDTGRGIAPEAIDSIFDRFRQVDASSSRQHGGVGLGLSIAKELAELHEGSIDVVSLLGKGSTFKIMIQNNEPVKNNDVFPKVA